MEFNKGIIEKQRSNFGVTTLKDIGLTKINSHRYQKVADYQHLIPEAIKQAKASKDLPTRRDLGMLIKEESG